MYNTEWFIEQMKIRRPEDYDEYIILGEYVNYNTKIKAYHKPCERNIYITPREFLSKRKQGCRHCGIVKSHNKQRKTHEQYQKELPEGLLALTPYKGAYEKVTLHCFFCDSTYTRTAREALKGCNRCNRRFNRTINDIKEEVYKETNGKYKVVSTSYKNAHTKIDIKHLECGRIYKCTMANFRKGRRCSYCRLSTGEKNVEIYLNKNNIIYEQQKTFDDLYHTNKLSYDFYLPEYSILIEYQGEQHVRPIEHFGGMETFILQQKLDKLKSDYAYNNGYKLIEILYTNNDYKSIENILNKNLF